LTTSVFEMRRNTFLFWLGCALVSVGVVLHLPMFLMARNSGYVLAGMPMDTGMLLGMAAILLGYACSGYGLLPSARMPVSPVEGQEPLHPPEDAPLTAAHWRLAGLLSLALVIDVMKPASLGFVTPGMRTEYGVTGTTVAWLPFAALAGTVAGSFAWGWLADVYGRRASILVSSVMFVGTSICGAMPDFWWNVGMCFLMGAAAGGMLPVAYALLAEIMPTRHRGWSLVLVGGTGAVGGYFASSALSALLQPMFGWRIMWFLNLPTGLILIALSPFLPESARFLQQMGRIDEARRVLSRFGAVPARPASHADKRPSAVAVERKPSPARRGLTGITVALTLSGLSWGLVNFGLLLLLPGVLVAQGGSMAASSSLIAESTLIAAPTILIGTWLFAAWSTKGTLVLMSTMTVAGLLGLGLQELTTGTLSHPFAPLVLLIVGSSGVISTLLPYAAENYPLRVRGRATGWIAACSKLGGLLAQGLGLIGALPPFGAAALAVAVVTAVAAVLIAWLGSESRGRDLRELESAEWRVPGRMAQSPQPRPAD
jgi:putative MFS transporter